MSKLLRLPIRIKPTFWLVASIIGFINSSDNLWGIPLWIGVIFLSVLVHELGHALAAILFGQRCRIELVAFGGVTYHNNHNLSLWKQFLITLNGPLFGFGLFLVSQFILNTGAIESPDFTYFFRILRDVNLIWTIVNLIPVMPLDGGHLVRVVLEAIFPQKGFQYSLTASAIAGVLFALLCFVYNIVILGIFFILMAFQNFESRRRFKNFTAYDRRSDIKHILFEAEQFLKEGHKEEALKAFERIREESKEGMSYVMATQYLAYLKYEMGDVTGSYELLSSIQNELSGDGLSLLHQTAFEVKDYDLVKKLAAEAFQNWPDRETALRNAFACAHFHDIMPTLGWLRAALEKGALNLPEILEDKVFDGMRQDERFVQFLDKLKNP